MNGWLIRVRPRNVVFEPNLKGIYVNSARVMGAREYEWGWEVELDNGETWLVHEDSAADME